jgi:hypothetical protein
MDTFKFFNADTGTISNYQPKGDFYTICTPDGSKYDSDYLVLDVIDKVFRYRHDAVYVRYIDGFTTGNNVSYSEILDEYILCTDAEYDNELCDYIFNELNESKNDNDRIERRRIEMRRRNEERARRDAERAKRREEEALELEKLRAERAERGEEEPELGNTLHEILSQYSGYLDMDTSGIFDMIRRSSPGIRRSRRIAREEEPTQAPAEPTEPTPIDTSRFNIVYDMPPLDYYNHESQEESFDDLPF